MLAVEKMPEHVHEGAHGYSVPNPVEPREDFADRWRERPELATKFFDWLKRLGEDLREADSVRGLDHVVSRLSESFGEGPVAKAAGQLGDEYRRARERGALGFAGTTGLISTSGRTPVRDHDFYGEVS
ncbi:MAG: hypothetical protein FVQ78_09650 [Solirubrobacterales bacterium]|nr:hypothetical protein [Solirubrobacterales bacterium]